jgi:branched-chain amino acid aminotransferase
VHDGKEHKVGTGDIGPLTRALRERLVSLQLGKVADRYGWSTRIA